MGVFLLKLPKGYRRQRLPEANFEKPADGNVLVCCSQPIGAVVIDL
jgi:hypothetical protein